MPMLLSSCKCAPFYLCCFCSHAAAYLQNCWSKQSWFSLLGRGALPGVDGIWNENCLQVSWELLCKFVFSCWLTPWITKAERRNPALIPNVKHRWKLSNKIRVWGVAGKFCFIKLQLFLHEHVHLKKKTPLLERFFKSRMYFPAKARKIKDCHSSCTTAHTSHPPM